MNDRYLAVYLNDHHAGSVVGVELSDRASLQRIMERFGVKEDKVKSGAAFVGEKLGRLKPNAQLTGYSPLSRVVELEGLSLGVTGKLGLWRALRNVSDSDERLDPEELDALIVRAEQQREGLEQHRLSAVAEALTG